MAIAIANNASRIEAPKATLRGQRPVISSVPRDISAIVAAQARKGIVNAGMNEFTLAVKLMKWAKCSRSSCPSQIPKREATAERKATPRAMRA